ncbi:MAG TPA: hypothetical protein VMB50_16445 [Myxococcales bacterium]|nr:hypothetical protein [Myxococcales bacterium]
MKTQWMLWMALALPAAGALGQEGTAMPVVEHNPVTRAAPGQPLTLTATIHSSNGVFQPVVDFRHVGETSWTKVPLLPSGNDVYTATLPGATISSDVEYYLEAYDNDGNGPARAGSPDNPLHVTVAAAVRQVTAQAAATPSAPKPAATAEKSGGGISGQMIGGAVSAGVGLVGLGIGIYGWAEWNTEVTNNNKASPSARASYQSAITQFLVVGVAGTAVGVVGLGIGAWLFFTGHSSSSASTPDTSKDSGTFSLAPVPGGAMAAYAGRF